MTELPANVAQIMQKLGVNKVIVVNPTKDTLRKFIADKGTARFGVIVAVNDTVCFSPNCWFTKRGIRCAGCTHIDDKGNVTNERVGGK